MFWQCAGLCKDWPAYGLRVDVQGLGWRGLGMDCYRKGFIRTWAGLFVIFALPWLGMVWTGNGLG